MSFWNCNLIRAYRIATWPWRQVALMRDRVNRTVPIAILFYHRIADEPINDWTISAELFQRQVDWMQRHFDLISLPEVQQRMQNGNRRPALSITFDDGYADNCNFALPMLIERRIPVTYFVSTYQMVHNQPFPHDLTLQRPLAVNSMESLRALHRAGVEIGGHARNHVDLGAGRTDEFLYDQTVVAARELESMIGCQIRYFSFPYGQKQNLDPRVFRLLKQAGFCGVCSSYGGLNSVADDPFHLQRIHGDPNFQRIANWLTGDPRMRWVAKYDWESCLPTSDWGYPPPQIAPKFDIEQPSTCET